MEENQSESEFAEDFGYGLFDDIPEGAIHPLLVDEYEDEAEMRHKLKNRRGANIYAPVKGSTQLHRAIRELKESRTQMLIDVYQEDFKKVGSYLEKEYLWDSAENKWLRKVILVASSEEECRIAKSLENKQISSEDLCEAVFVLLQHPVNEEEIAVLHPDESTRLSVIKLINRLIPNGFLSWSTIEIEEKHETFMETAASCGLNHVIDRLYEFGAPIAIPHHNPLLSACRSSRKDTVQWLLTKHIDSFDCTLRDEHQSNALIVAMQKNDRKMFDLCLEKMIAYRQKYYNETESEAFGHLFRFESEDLSSLSIFTFLRKGPVSGSIERAIEKYGIDLAYQWQGVTILICMLCRNIAKEYCYEGIRNNPELLGMVVYGNTNVLHEMIRLEHFAFLRELYELVPEVKDYFNSEGAFNALSTVLHQRNHDTVQFILEHHMEYLRSNNSKLKDIVCGNGYCKEHFEQNSELLIRFFPEYSDEIKQAKSQALTQTYSYGKLEQKFKQSFIYNIFYLQELKDHSLRSVLMCPS